MTIKKGFTLAEVLITLSIIGVIAAIVTPTLSTSIQNAQNRARFQKAINSLANAVAMNVMLDNYDFGQATSTATTGDDMSVFNILNHRLEIVGIEDSAESSSNYTIFFNDGFSLDIPKNAKECTEDASCNGIVDVNGKAAPNTIAACDNGDTANCKVTVTADRYPVKLYDDTVVPNSAPSRAVLFKK